MSGFSEYDRHDAAAILSMNRPEALKRVLLDRVERISINGWRRETQ